MLGRRRFLASAAAAAALPRIARAARTTAPNILFIMADDLGYADVGCYGREDVATPHIDSLARDGIKFTDAYSSSSVCSPTRLSLMTGRYPGREAAGLDEPIARNPQLGITGPSFVTALARAGYQTSLVGKWHLGHLPQYSPLLHGYARFFGAKTGAVDYITHLDYDGVNDLWEDDRKVERPGYLTNLLGERAAGEIRRFSQQPRPFLVSLHFTAPHWPWETEADQAAPKELINLRHRNGGNIALYREMIEVMDRNIGLALEALRATGRERDTIVVFTSDNGGERFSKSWPFNGRKGELLEGGVRVPLLTRWPARIAAGSTSPQVASTMDWAPTFLSAAEIAPSFPLDGISLMPTLTGSSPTDRTLFWRHKAYDQQAVRRGPFKYLSINKQDYLFDLSNDPQEMADLKERKADLFKELQAAWRQWNAGMLPYPKDSYSDSSRGVTADRY